MGQIHPQHLVARLQQSHVDGAVGLRAGVRLNVCVGGTKEFLGAFDGQGFDHVDILATTVVTLARIAFGVLVGQLRTLGLHDPRAGVVFGGDQLDVLFLAHGFIGDGRPQRGIVIGNVHVTLQHPYLLTLRNDLGGRSHSTLPPGR